MSRTTGEATADLVMYGKPDCVDALRSRRLLDRNGVAYEFRDVLNDADLAAEARRISGGPRTPVLVFADGSFVVEPSDADLADRLGLSLNAVVAEGAEDCEI